MTTIRYSPGAWLAVVRARTVVLLPEGSSADLISDVWQALGRGMGMDRLLEQVAGGFSHGWTGMRPFAVVSYADALHTVLRGRLELRTTSDAGRPEEVSGEQVATWSERILPGGKPFTLRARAAEAPADLPDSDSGEGWLPLIEGVVRCSEVHVVPDEAVSVEAVPDEAVSVGSPEPVADLNATISPDIFGTVAQPLPRPELVPEAAPVPQAVPVSEAAQAPQPQPAAALPAPEAPAEEDSTTGYDHLWDRTVVRRVEDAAVRQDEADDAESAEAEPANVAGNHAGGSEAEIPQAQVQTQTPSAAGPAPIPATPRAVELIDSVPWQRPRGNDRAETDPGVSVTPTTVPDEGHLPPTLPELSREPGTGGPEPREFADAGDHDGRTIMRSALPDALPAAGNPTSGNPTPGKPTVGNPAEDAGNPADDGTGPLVLARLCPNGHANPPTQPVCAICAKTLASEPRQVRRPSLGRVHISTGEVVELDRPAVIGRQPSASRVQGDDMPRMVQVHSEAQDISRSHVEIRLEGWHVMLCDLKATNGTVLIRGDRPPRRLDEGESTIILDGDVAELGEDVTLRFEGIR